MPEEIINKFKDQYGDKKGEQVYYATANAQGRDPETFKKESTMAEVTLEQLEKELEEEMGNLEGVVLSVAPDVTQSVGGACPCPPTPIGGPEVVPPIAPAASPLPTATSGLPEVAPGAVVPPAVSNVPVVPPIETEAPPEGGPLMEKKKDAETEKAKKQLAGVGAGLDRTDNKHMPPKGQVHADKKKKHERKPKHKTDWKQFDESVNLYIAKTSRNSDIGVNTLEKMWKECVEEQEKGQHPRSSRSFWLEVRTKFDKKVNDIFLQEAKKRMGARQKMTLAIEAFLEHVAKDKYVEAKPVFKEMVAECLNSMISDRKVQYQKALAEEIAKKVKEAK